MSFRLLPEARDMELATTQAWDCISRYIYTALQGGSIMRGWTNDERMMIACCNDGTRPVIFRICRCDYKVVKVDGLNLGEAAEKIKAALEQIPGTESVQLVAEKGWIEVYMCKNAPVADETLKEAVEKCGNFKVTGID